MKLKDVRKQGIKYCEDNDCKYTYISYDDVEEFYLTHKENRHTVFLVNKNGSLDAYLSTKYAMDFHEEYDKKNNHRKENGKKKIAEIANYVEEADEHEEDCGG